MAHVLKPRVAETSTTTGTGAFTLSGALTGHQRFSAVCSTSDTTEYVIIADDGTWEEGFGTYSSANTLTRTTVSNSSSAGAAVNFAAGNKTVLMTPQASRVGGIPRSSALMKGDGAGALSAASAGTDYASPSQTFYLGTTQVAINRASAALTLDGITLTDPAIVGTITEDVYTISDGASVDINPSNGSIQLWTLGASRTPTATSFGAGESVTLMVNDGTAYTITWTSVSVTWIGGAAPTLDTTKYTVIELWKVGSTVYGALVGYA